MNALLEYLKGRKPKGLNPVPQYNRDGNFLSWYWKDADCYAESVHDADGVWVGTLERSMETHEVVGVKIHCEAINV